MGRMIDMLKGLFQMKQDRESVNVEELRTAFQARYHQFKLLLNANNKALEIMAEMEEALGGGQPFGMNFVQARLTGVSTSVWQIIKHLNDLAPGKYEALYGQFKEIQKKINQYVQRKSLGEEGPLVLPLDSVDKDMADQVGSKVANLGEIRNRIQLRVSNGFAITASAYQRFMEHNDLQAEIDRLIQATDVERLDQLFSLSANIQQLIIRSSLPEDLEVAINEQYRLLEEEDGKGINVAMRSSALGEDLAGITFAGQYRSELNVSSENIAQAYKEIVASKYGLPGMTYRLNRGIRDEDVVMCVGCMSMVDAVAGGVTYSANPVNIQDNSVLVNAVWGLPKSVVDGNTPSDLFVVSRGEPMTILEKDIPVKTHKYACYPDEGLCRIDITGDKSRQASLKDEQVLELAKLAVRLEAHYGGPQDIEWAVRADGSIVLLQCRPLEQKGATNQDRDSDMFNDLPPLLRGGVTASPGVAAGPVFIVKKEIDTLKFPSGGVLVTAQSLPRWAMLLNRAAAVVTEQGSMAGHLANVAREFGVPALFGIKNAVQQLKNGQPVTVDADCQRIYEGRIDVLLERQKSPKNLMEGSPVYEALKGAGKHIIPLRLLDPYSPRFTPKNCRTFHDITRFCHEKVVDEMFRFGKEHRFPERSSKQLFCETPMKWWILNLDDGFSEEVEGKFVRLDNIVSIPMLALWEGIIAVPWEGPPPVDGKGFMSIMFQATTNTALNTGVRSEYAARNYFMISKNYCSLSSRLGFHFSTVEALVSDRSGENYINFQFKGGAADDLRKQKRVFFVGNILEEYGFRVEIKQDHLAARIEGHEKYFMIDRLKIVGYMTIHTRQIDIILFNHSKVNYYRTKITKDINEIIGPT
ncbi:MAG: pyruvate, water dikinase [Deltaproteobacteria bacterium]|nr:pyruvate, water dikinase [Deltaproteobacteria bacterium]